MVGSGRTKCQLVRLVMDTSSPPFPKAQSSLRVAHSKKRSRSIDIKEHGGQKRFPRQSRLVDIQTATLPLLFLPQDKIVNRAHKVVVDIEIDSFVMIHIDIERSFVVYTSIDTILFMYYATSVLGIAVVANMFFVRRLPDVWRHTVA